VEKIQYMVELPRGVDPFTPGNFKLTAEGEIRHSVTERPDLIPE
jgi:hypothetical protein